MDDLTIDTFATLVGADFRVADATVDDALTLRLTEVESGGRQPDAPRAEPFTLVFIGPPRPILEQRIYRLEHAERGGFEIFLVPIGYDPSGSVRYEAVFN